MVKHWKAVQNKKAGDHDWEALLYSILYTHSHSYHGKFLHVFCIPCIFHVLPRASTLLYYFPENSYAYLPFTRTMLSPWHCIPQWTAIRWPVTDHSLRSALSTQTLSAPIPSAVTPSSLSTPLAPQGTVCFAAACLCAFFELKIT